MRIIITGGAGFIGSHIVDLLSAGGHSVYVIDNLSTGTRQNLPQNVPFYEIDIRDRTRLQSVFEEVRPEAVCHQAASVTLSMRAPIFDAEINVMGLLNVFECAAQAGVKRIISASSGGVIYGSVTEPVSENAVPNPVSPYGISKWVGEKYLEYFARDRKLQAVVLRYSNVYGPRQYPHGEGGVIAIFANKMLKGETATIHGDGLDVRDFVYGPDVARANVAALTCPLDAPFTVLNVGTGRGINIVSVSKLISTEVQSFLSSRSSSIQVPPCHHGEQRSGDLRSNLVSPKRAGEILGWSPTVQLAEGLRETVKWFGSR